MDIRIENLEVEVDNSHHILFIAYHNNEFCGTVRCECKDRRSAYMYVLYVSPDHRCFGIAIRLVESCLKEAKKLNCESLTLEVNKNNRVAMQLYRKLKFRIVYDYDESYLMSLDIGRIDRPYIT